MSRAREVMQPGYLKRILVEQEGMSIRMARRALITAAALTLGLLSGCGATRPAKYYQLTVPTEPGAVQRGDAVPVTLLLGAIMTSHLYREDRLVYGNGTEQLG